MESGIGESSGCDGGWSRREVVLVCNYVEMGNLLKVFEQGRGECKVVYEKINPVKWRNEREQKLDRAVQRLIQM